MARIPGTLVLVGFTGALAVFQHVLAPAASMPTAWLVDLFAVHSTAPGAVGTWVTAPLLHLSVGHFLKNVGPLLVVGGYLEARYGTGTWLLTCTVVGALAYGAFASLVAVAVDAPWFFVGASTIWYGMVAFLALNGDAATVTLPPGSDGRSRCVVVPFGYGLAVCVVYTAAAVVVGGVLTPGVVPTLHLLSLAVGAGWWVLLGPLTSPAPGRERSPGRGRSSVRQ